MSVRARHLLAALAALAALGPATACRRAASRVVPLEAEVARPAPGTNLPGLRGVTHDPTGARQMWRRGRSLERARLSDLQAAHARLALLDAEIEEERAQPP